MTDSARRELVRRWLPAELLAENAYHVAPAEGLIKLDAMENPHAWPASLSSQWSEQLREVPINRYPDAGASALCKALRSVYGIPAELDLVLGNGSDELIQLLNMAMRASGGAVLAPQPSFVVYGLSARALGMDFVPVALRTDFALDTEAMLAAIEQHAPALVYLAWPNNPTGNLFDEAAVERIIAHAPGLVAIDEAYYPFARRSWLARLPDYPNVVLLRTLSKAGLAGLRLGYLVAAPEWAREFNKLRMPYNINSLTQATALFALEHRDAFDEQIEAILAERERLCQMLRALPGVEVYPSATNFVLIRVGSGNGSLHRSLLKRGVLVKDLHGADPATSHCLRVSVGLPTENDAFIQALRDTLAANVE